MEVPAANSADVPHGKPWSPTTIMWITAILGGFPGFVLHTLNVRRLGLDRPFAVELAKNSTGFILLFTVVLFDSLPRIALLAIVLCLAGYFGVSQQEAFRAHVAAGGSRGSSTRAAFVGVGVIATVFVVGAVGSEIIYQFDLERFESFIEADELDSAEQLAEGQLETYPGDYAILWNLARIKAYRGDLAGARSDLQDMLRIYPDDSAVLAWVADIDEVIAEEGEAGRESADSTVSGGAS